MKQPRPSHYLQTFRNPAHRAYQFVNENKHPKEEDWVDFESNSNTPVTISLWDALFTRVLSERTNTGHFELLTFSHQNC